MSRPSYLGWDPEFRARMYASMRDVFVDFVDDRVVAGLDAVARVRAGLIRDDGPDALLWLGSPYARSCGAIAHPLGSLGGRPLKIGFATEIEDADGTPLVFARRHGRLLLGSALVGDIVPEPVDITDDLTRIGLEVLVHERETTSSGASRAGSPSSPRTPTAVGQNRGELGCVSTSSRQSTRGPWPEAGRCLLATGSFELGSTASVLTSLDRWPTRPRTGRPRRDCDRCSVGRTASRRFAYSRPKARAWRSPRSTARQRTGRSIGRRADRYRSSAPHRHASRTHWRASCARPIDVFRRRCRTGQPRVPVPRDRGSG